LQLKFCVNQRLKAEEKGKILACVGTFWPFVSIETRRSTYFNKKVENFESLKSNCCSSKVQLPMQLP
jgi:hypothetical protein